jgi:diacylglycerol kinase family enzyme
MAGIGIVNNPRSRRNQRRPSTARRLRSLLDGDGEVKDASTLEELDAAVAQFKDAGIDLLGVNGGDGTGHLVLTAFAEAYGDRPLPRLALLRGGTMNTVAHSHDLRGSPESILRHILARRRNGGDVRVVERDLLRVQGEGVPTRYGFIFGTGMVVTFLEAYYGTGRPTPATAAVLLGRTIGSAVVGGKFATRLVRRDPARVTADGEDWPDQSYLSILAASVPQIGFGFAPCARCDEQPGFFHAVGVTASPLQLVADIPAIYLGRPWRRSLAMDAVARELTIDTGGPVSYTIDGDLYESQGPVRITTGPAIEIVVA